MSSPEDGLRQRRDKADAEPRRSRRYSQQQQLMFRQMQQHRRVQKVQTLAMKESLSDLMCSYCKVLVGICVVGLVLLCVLVSPTYLWERARSLFWDTRPLLPPRNLVLIPPIPVQRMLPRVYRNYAVATPENLAARQVLRQTAALRQVATHAGPYRQRISLHTVEHEQVQGQLPTDQDKDAVCGPGFARAYNSQNNNNNNATTKDHLVLFCLLTLGTHDGYVLWNTTLTAPLTRGTRGVAAKYVHQNRVHASLLLLPILSRERVVEAARQGNNNAAVQQQPSTRLPRPTLEWLIQHSQNGDMRRELEEFLYTMIIAEEEEHNWVLLNAACSSKERARLDAEQQRRIGTTCSDDNDEDDCCSFYDPSIKAFAHRQDDDDDDDE